MNLTDTRRHADYVPLALQEQIIQVIGTGGVGSHVVELLSRMRIGTSGSVLYDGDIVEAHNIPNQQFLPEHIGQKKVTALASQAAVWSNGTVTVTTIDEFVTTPVNLSGIVIMCLDSMDARRTIMRSSIFGKKEITTVVETRMDAGLAEVFIFNPHNIAHQTLWETWWFPDSAAQNLAGCSGPIAIPTATSITASLAVQLLLNQFRESSKPKPHHLRLNLETWLLSSEVWPDTLDEDDY